MTKDELFTKMLECRDIADEVCADAYDFKDDKDRWEIIWRAERILDEIDGLLNYLKSEEELK